MSTRQAPGGNSTFSVGWTGELEVIKPSRKPGDILEEKNRNEEIIKVQKKQINIQKEDSKKNKQRFSLFLFLSLYLYF